MLLGPLIMSIVMGFTATLSSTAAMTRLREIGVIGRMLDSLSWVTPLTVIIASFTVLYLIVPNASVRFKPALIGGVFAGILWALSGNLFTSFIVSVSRYEAIYAGFAIVLVAMIWLKWLTMTLRIWNSISLVVNSPSVPTISTMNFAGSATRIV